MRTRHFGAFAVLIGLLGYSRGADAWTHEAIYGWYPSCALAATLRSRTVFQASDYTDWGGDVERSVRNNRYYRNMVEQSVNNQLITDYPPFTGDETVFLAFFAGGQQVSTLPPHLDGVWRINAFARGDRWVCWPGFEGCVSPNDGWYTVAGPGEGAYDTAEGPIDP